MVVAAVVGRAAKAVAAEATIEVAETVARAGMSKGETATGLSEAEAGAGVDETQTTKVAEGEAGVNETETAKGDKPESGC